MHNFQLKSDVRFTDEAKLKVKEPLGMLIKGNVEEVVKKTENMIKSIKPLKIIVIGDFSSKVLKERGIAANVYVIDNKIMRKKVKEIKFKGYKKIRAVNPAGMITVNAFEALRDAIANDKVAVIIDGEEDLLTLIAIILAPNGSLIIYGQPNEGNVLVYVNDERKKFATRIINSLL